MRILLLGSLWRKLKCIFQKVCQTSDAVRSSVQSDLLEFSSSLATCKQLKRNSYLVEGLTFERKWFVSMLLAGLDTLILKTPLMITPEESNSCYHFAKSCPKYIESKIIQGACYISPSLHRFHLKYCITFFASEHKELIFLLV